MAFKRLVKIFSWVTGVSVGTSLLLVGILLTAAAIFVRTEYFQNSLRDRLVQVAREELGLEIQYQSATISLFSFEPKVEFQKIRLEHRPTRALAEIEKLKAGISLFVSVPLLFVRSLHLSSISIDGFHYELNSLKTLQQWIENLKPRHAFLPTAFQTTVGKVGLSNIQVDIALPDHEFYGEGLQGKIFLKNSEVDLESAGVFFSGDLDLTGLKTKGHGPFDGNLILANSFYYGTGMKFGNIKFSHGPDQLLVSGEMKNWENLQIAVKGKGDFAVENYFVDLPINGRVRTDFDLSGPIRQLKGKGAASFDDLMLRGKKWTQLRTTWKIDSSRIEINTIESSDQNGQSRIKLIWPFSRAEKSTLSVNFKDAEFKDYIGILSPKLQAWDGLMNGDLTFEGLIGRKVSGVTKLSLSVSKIRIKSPSDFSIYQIDQANMTGTMKLEENGAAEFVGRVNAGTYGLGVHGNFDSKRMRMDIMGSFPGGDAGVLLGHRVGIRGSLKAVLEGSWSQLQLTMSPLFSDFSLGEHHLTDVSGQLVYLNNTLSGVPIHADQLSVYGGIFFNPHGPSEFSNFRFTTRSIDPGFVFSLIGLDNNVVRSIRGKLTSKGSLRGPLSKPIGSGSITIDDWLFHKMITKGKTASAKWATAGSDIFFDQASLQFSEEELPLVGEMSFDGHGLVDLSLESNRVRFSSLQDLQGLSLPVQSLAFVRVDYQRGLPALKINSKLTKTFISGNPEPDSELFIDWVKDQARLDVNLFGDSIKAHADVMQNLQSRDTTISVFLSDFNLGSFSRSFNQTRLETPISGRGLVNFKQKRGAGNLLQELFEKSGAFSGEISIDSATVIRSGVTLHNLDSTKVRVRSGTSGWPQFQFDKVTLRSDAQSLNASGFFENSDLFEVQMKGQVDLRSWTALYPFLSRSEGTLNADGLLKPSGFFGRMKIEKGLLNFQNSPLFVRNVEASIDSDGASLRLNRLNGDFREGSVTAEGKVKIVSRKIESGDFSLKLQGTLFQPVTGVSFRASGPLSLKIAHDQGEVAGRLSIRDGVYRRHLDAKADALKFFESSRLDLGTSTEDVPSWKRWKLNIDINSETPVLVRNNLVDGNLNLHLRTVGTFQSPRLQGNMTIVNGQFYYVNRQFTVRSGSIQFTDPTSNIPVFDIRADTEISDSSELYRVYLRILGSADNQKISYSSDPTLSEKDILSLVVSGFRASNPASVTQDPTKSAYYSGISFVTGQFQDRIERGLGTGLGIRRFGLSPSFSDTTKSTELQLTVGTDLIRNKLEVNYSNLLSTRGGHKVELELKMNRIVSLIGSWRNIEGGTDQDFGGDLRFRFEFE